MRLPRDRHGDSKVNLPGGVPSLKVVEVVLQIGMAKLRSERSKEHLVIGEEFNNR